MSIAKLFWLTSPETGRYVINIQRFGSEDLEVIEVGPDHLRNFLIDGITHWLRNSLHRVPKNTIQESANVGSGNRAQ